MSTNMATRSARQDDWSFHIVAQTDQDQIPATPEFNELHLRTSGLGVDSPVYTQSSAITVDGQPRDNIKTGVNYAAELAAETNTQQATLLAAALESDVQDLSVTASTISTTATDIVDSGGAAFTDYRVGDFLFAADFIDESLNVTYLITAKADNGTITVNPSPAVAEPEGASVTISSFKSSLSKEPCLFVGQNRVPDLSQAADIAYESFVNGFTSTYGLSIPEEGIITSTLNMVFETKNPGLLPITGQTDAPLQTGQVATTPLKTVWLDGVKSEECFLKTLDINLDNGYVGNAVAQCTAKRQSKGIPTLGGSISTVQFIDNTYEWKNRVDSGTTVALAITIDFKDGNCIVISMPRVKLTSWSSDGDTALSNAMDFSCEKDPVLGTAIEVFANFQY